jgi:hypothetical protein
MTRKEFEKIVCSLDGDALEVLDGEVDGFDSNSPFNPGNFCVDSLLRRGRVLGVLES